MTQNKIFYLLKKLRHLITLSCLALLTACLPLLFNLKFHHNPLDWIAKDSPELNRYLDSEREFGRNNTLLFSLQTDSFLKDISAFNSFDRLTEKWASLPGVEESFSPLEYLKQNGLKLPASDKALERTVEDLKKLASNPLFRGSLLSDDLSHMGVIVFLSRDNPHPPVWKSISNDLKAASIPHSFCGAEYFADSLQLLFKRDVAVIAGCLLLLCFLIILLLTKDFRWIISTAFILTVSACASFSLFTLEDGRLSLISLMLLPLIFTVVVSGSIHLYSASQRFTKENDPVIEALKTVLVPGFFSAVTTAIGTSAFFFSKEKAISALGFIAPLSILISFMSAYLILPFVYLTLEGKPSVQNRVRVFKSISGALKYMNIFAAAAIVAGGFFLSPKIGIDGDAMSFFLKTSDLRRNYSSVERTLTGTQTIEIIFQKMNKNRVFTAEDIQTIENFENKLKQSEWFRSHNSLTQLINEVLSRKYGKKTISDASNNQIEWSLKTLKNKATGVLSRYFTHDASKVRASVRFDRVSTDSVNKIITSLWKNEPASSSIQLYTTGFVPLILKSQQDIVRSQIYVYLAIFVLMGGVFILIFRSIRLCAAAMVVNLVPIASVLTAAYLLGYRFNMINIFVLSVLLGIIVDDTVHILYVFKRRRSISEALQITRPAVLKTSLAVGVGFCALFLSQIPAIKEFGLLSVTAIAVAYWCDIYLLPALLD